MEQATSASSIQVIEHFDDPLWRLNNLYHCVNEMGKKLKFQMNESQFKLFKEMWYFNIVLKARQLGFTTFIDILGLDQALFNDDFSVGVCAHREKDVTKIFEKKIKFPYDNLAEGLRTARNTSADSATFMKFSNGSSIEVGLSLRSGTYQFVHISEFGKLCLMAPDRADEVISGTLEAVHAGNMVFIESTAEGNKGKFAEYAMTALANKYQGVKLNPLQYKFHFFPWWDKTEYRLNPDGVLIDKRQQEYFVKLEDEKGIVLDARQRAWWAQKERNLGDRIFKEHPSTPEEAFKASVEGCFLSNQMAKVRTSGRIGRVPYDSRFPVNIGFDLGRTDEMWLWFHQKIGLEHRIIDVMHHRGEGPEWYAEQIRRRGYYIGRLFLPHDGSHNNITGLSVQNQLWDLGFRDVVVVPRTGQKITAINVTRSFLGTCVFDETNCSAEEIDEDDSKMISGLGCLDMYRKEWDASNGCWKDTPKHDDASHGYDAFETLARGVTELGTGSAHSQHDKTTGMNRDSARRGRSSGRSRSWRTS